MRDDERCTDSSCEQIIILQGSRYILKVEPQEFTDRLDFTDRLGVREKELSRKCPMFLTQTSEPMAFPLAEKSMAIVKAIFVWSIYTGVNKDKDFCLGHIKFEMSIRYPIRYIKYEDKYISLKIKKIQTGVSTWQYID